MSRIPAIRPTAYALALFALTALGLALTIFIGTSSQASVTMDCGTQRTLTAAPNANVDFDPTSGAPGAPFTTMLTGAPFNMLAGGGEVEVIMGFNPSVPGSGVLAGEGTLPEGQTAVDVPSAVPDLTAGAYPLYMCWKDMSFAGGPVWYYTQGRDFTVLPGPDDDTNDRHQRRHPQRQRRRRQLPWFRRPLLRQRRPRSTRCSSCSPTSLS